MEFDFNFKQSRITKLDLDTRNLKSFEEIGFEFNFSLGINQEDINQAKLDGILVIKEKGNISSFLNLEFEGFYLGNNDNPQLTFKDMQKEQVNSMIISLLESISPTLQLLLKESIGLELDLMDSFKKNLSID